MPERLVVIGGDAGGMGAASQALRLRPDLDVVAFERGTHTSYALCGLPYLVGGEVDEAEALVARTPAKHRERGIDVRTRHEVVGIDLDRRHVAVRDLDAGTEVTEPFDRLVVATGASPIRPPLPGIDLPEVLGLTRFDDGPVVRERVDALPAGARAVVVGAGYIGIEVAESLRRRDLHVVMVEAADQVMSTLDADMADHVASALRAAGVELRLSEPLAACEPDAVDTDAGTYQADLIVLGMGVGPNADLAAASGLALGARGAVAVDDHQRTSAEGVYAAGDCCDSRHLVTGERVHVALGTVANRQARVAGINLGGGDATFPGVAGSAVTRFFDTEIGRTGLTEREAAAAGLDAEAATVTAGTRSRYMPEWARAEVKLVVERGSRRVLGAQIVGGAGSAKRIDTVAVALSAGFTVDQLLDVDFSYAPPFSPVWDPVQVAARVLA